MASPSNSPDNVPIPALLVERAIALARAEAGLALVHVRRLAVRAVSALLGTIVACAFAQLTLLLLVAWPVLAARVSLVNLLFGVLTSAVLAAAGAALALTSWAGVARERKATAAGPARASGRAASTSSSAMSSSVTSSSVTSSSVTSNGIPNGATPSPVTSNRVVQKAPLESSPSVRSSREPGGLENGKLQLAPASKLAQRVGL